MIKLLPRIYAILTIPAGRRVKIAFRASERTQPIVTGLSRRVFLTR
jgi:hypothetical protein